MLLSLTIESLGSNSIQGSIVKLALKTGNINNYSIILSAISSVEAVFIQSHSDILNEEIIKEATQFCEQNDIILRLNIVET